MSVLWTLVLLSPFKVCDFFLMFNPETVFPPPHHPFGYVQFLSESKRSGWLKDPTTKQKLKKKKKTPPTQQNKSWVHLSTKKDSKHHFHPCPIYMFLLITGFMIIVRSKQCQMHFSMTTKKNSFTNGIFSDD